MQNPDRTNLGWLVAVLLLTAGLATTAQATTTPTSSPLVSEEASPGDPLSACQEGDADPRCPPSTREGASCVSHALLVLERDDSGTIGDVHYTQATSQAASEPTKSSEWPKLDLIPPADPHAQAENAAIDESYEHPSSGLTIDAQVSHSRCDVLSLNTVTASTYGAVGFQGLEITHEGAPLVSTQALTLEHEAVVTEAAEAQHRCHLVDLALPVASASGCTAPPTATIPGLTLDPAWGPQQQGNQWTYAASAAHLALQTPEQTLDVYVGYVALGLHADYQEAPTSLSPPLLR